MYRSRSSKTLPLCSSIKIGHNISALYPATKGLWCSVWGLIMPVHATQIPSPSKFSKGATTLLLAGLTCCLPLLSGCSEIPTANNEVVNIEPFYNSKERLAKLPQCHTTAKDRCIVISKDASGDSIMLPYSHGQLTGMAVSLFANGQVKAIYTYQDGQRNGLFSEFYHSGIERYSGRYSQNQLEGVLKTNYSNGVIKNLTYYEHDLKHGYSINFHNDGRLYSESNYFKAQVLNPVKTYREEGGFIESYYTKGKITKASVFYPNNERQDFIYTFNQLNGFARLFYANGNLKRSIKIVDGYQDGLDIRYYPDGQIQGLSNFKRGRLHGKSLRYWDDGQLQLVLMFKNDRLNSAVCDNGVALSEQDLAKIAKEPFTPHKELCLLPLGQVNAITATSKDGEVVPTTIVPTANL